jgi:phosphoglycerate dehydrogenase-like enzyme
MSDSPGKNRASRLVAQPSDDQRPATDEGELAMKIVLISGTRLIGSKSVAILRQGGQEVIAASPKVGVNTITADGLKEALAGAHVVIDLSNSPSF